MSPSVIRRRLLGATLMLPAAALWRSQLARADVPAIPAYAAPGSFAVTTLDAQWHDASRGRDVPVRVRLPQGATGPPLLLFSHGLGGSRAGGAVWAQHWASHGYLTINVQHPGSDESLWRGRVDPSAGMAGIRERLRGGMTPKAFLDRVEDIHFVIDEALRQRGRPGAALATFDGERIGMSGHSFCAITTLAVCGQRYSMDTTFTDTRIRAGLAFSPSAGPQAQREQRFAAIHVPMLVITGTRDGDVMGTGATPESRRATYAALSPPDKYLVVLDGAEHMNFGGGEHQNLSREGRHYTSAVTAISQAYWNAMLEGDQAARSWLADETRTVLAAGDVFAAK